MKYTALIPVRAGSRRLPNKNILPFGDSNLLVHKIRQLKKIPLLDEIIVSSDSEEMLEMARQEGVGTHKRAIEYADEKTKSWGEIVSLWAKSVCHGDNVMMAYCVTPLCDVSHYTEAIDMYEKYVLCKKEYDSVASVKTFKEYLWDDVGPVNYRVGLGHVPSQELPDWFVIVNGFFIAPRASMVKWNYQIGKKPFKLAIPKHAAVDIDDADDFAIAEALYKKFTK